MLGFCYYRIAIFFRKNYNPRGNRIEPKRQKAQADALVLKKCIALSVSFFVAYSPTIVLLLITSYSKVTWSSGPSAVAKMMISVGCAINPWQMIYFDPVFAKNLRLMFSTPKSNPSQSLPLQPLQQAEVDFVKATEQSRSMNISTSLLPTVKLPLA
jgi:hypothetical protein